VQPYLSSARRYCWVALGILAIVWGAGLFAGYVEYKTTFEAKATIWVLKAAADLTVSNPDDPSVPLVQTAANQQADLLKQLIATRSFIVDVIGRTSLRTTLERTGNENALLDDVRKHFKVQTLGPNMLSVTFAGTDPSVAAELVQAALDERTERLTHARVEGTTALGALYQREFEAAQTRVLDAQRRLEEFDLAHKPPLSDLDQHQQAQLRVAFDLAQVRVSDLQGRMDRAVLAPALLEISGMEFQVVDEPRVDPTPSGGMKNAVTLALVALASGVALAALLVIAGALLVNHVAGPADVGRLSRATLFASVPRVTDAGLAGGSLRSSLATIVFSDGPQGSAKEGA
jgi:hypothetical protein